MSFFGSFTGSTQRRDIRNANTQATNALQRGYDDSQGYYNQAAESYSPYAQEGRQASQFYQNALGLNGNEARSQAQGVIESDPIFQGQLALSSNALARNLNARGQSGGGVSALAGQRNLTEQYGNYLNRYRDAGRDGYQATNAQAGVRTSQGDNAYGYGATRAGQQINYGNALASSRNIGVNNLTALAGTAIRAYAGGR